MKIITVKKTLFTIFLAFVGISSYSQIVIEAETMTLGGSYAGLISSPFSGIGLYGNNDSGTITAQLPDGAGVYNVSVTGASNNSTSAGVSLYIDGEKKKTFSFAGTTATTQTAELRLPNLATSTQIMLKLETDNGTNDTYIDKIIFTYQGAIVVLPPPVLPAQGAYYTDSYRNMFVEAGLVNTDVQNKLQVLWDHFFLGAANQKVYYESGTDEAYILDVANNDVRSEGMSYAMMICVQMDKQAEFNRLWKWAKTKMQYTSGQYEGYFAWQLNPDGTIKGNGPASDGEEYFIMDLFFASHRWGNGTGIYDYSQEANDILYHCMRRGDTGGGVTNLFNSTQKQVTFVPYGNSATFTDPSYHLPAFYQLWSYWASDLSRRSFWADCATKSRQMFPLFANSTTGLMPDYAEFSGAARNEGDHKHFQYDAWRCIMNMAVDYSWFKAAEDEVTLVNKLHNFFEGQGIDSYGGLYQLNGSVINNNNDHSPGLVGCNASGALASNQSVAWDFINDFYNMSIPSGTYRYYDGLLYFMSYLNLSGNFKIYKPNQNAALNTLTVSDAAGELALNPTFYSDVFSYTVNVANETENVTIAATAPNGYTVAGTGEKSLETGANTFTVTVTKDANPSHTQDYTVVVTRGAGTSDECDRFFDFEDDVALNSAGNASQVSVVDANGGKAMTFKTSYGGDALIVFPVAGGVLSDEYSIIEFDIANANNANGKNIVVAVSSDGTSFSQKVTYGGQSNIPAYTSNSWKHYELDVSTMDAIKDIDCSFIGIGINNDNTVYYLDNVKFTGNPANCVVTSVAEQTAPSIYISDNILNISAKAQQVNIFTVDTRMVFAARNCSSIDLSSLASGIYIVKINIDGKYIAKKFIK